MIFGGRHSLTTRLTALFSSISTLILLLLGLTIGELVDRHFEELDQEMLHGKVELLQNAVRKIPPGRGIASIAGELDEALVGHHGLSVLIRDARGQVVYASGSAAFPKRLFESAHTDTGLPHTWKNPAGQPVRGMSARAPTQAAQEGAAIVAVATELTSHEAFMTSFRLALWASVGTAALLTGVLGWLAVRRGLAPLKKIRERAADITANRLDQRVEVQAIPVELAEVAETINGMLERLQESFRRLSEFSSDLAHELRTPVTNLLTQTQVMLAKPRDSADYREVLASNAEELERLSRTVADMLFLAKAENHLLVPHREDVDLAQEIRGLLEFYEVVLEDKRIRAGLSGQATIQGDRLMLRRAIGNLLSNAIRHVPEGGTISLALAAQDDGRVRLSITNTGATIAAEHLPRLFDRFYRVDASRHHSGDGAGLGLAIVKSIVQAHGGSIAVNSGQGLTTFALALPARPEGAK